MDERTQAKAIAERWLDEPYADPDGDQCVVARQFNRALEQIERQARVIAQWELGSAVVAERVIGPLMDAHSADSKHG